MPTSKPSRKTEMLPEYDFSDGVRGKYLERYRQETNVVLLEPDVAAAFPDSASVNQALRVLVNVAGRQVSQKGSSRRGPAAAQTSSPKRQRRAVRG
jgi:hypothetical protein